jgi:hypothetical protein
MEEKIVLAIKKETALYLFKRDGQAEFVVAYKDGNCGVGDYVESWTSGHYFFTLEDAVEYFKKRK